MAPEVSVANTNRIATKPKPRRWIRALLLCLVLLFSAPYFIIPHYSFSDAAPFKGQQWFNPYENLDSAALAHPLKANFHLHAKAWGGVTDGHNSAQQIDSIYRSMDYDVVNLSNYFRIDTLHQPADSSFIASYEHGFSLQKSHRLVLGAHSIQWFDVLTPQTVHIKQFLFSVLHPSCSLLVMAHPSFGRPSYTFDDVQKLDDYDCMEVLNHYRTSSAHWDSALSAGHKVWIIADDDSHQADDYGQTGVCWTLAYSASRRGDSVLSAIRTGKAIGVHGRRGRCSMQIEKLGIAQDNSEHVLQLRCSKPFIKARVVGQNGVLRQQDSASSELFYRLQDNDSYLRCEIETDSAVMYTNPVFRIDDKIVVQKSQIDVASTTLWYLGYLCLCIVCIYFARK